MLAQFTSIDGAARAVSAIIRGKIIPATLEFLDAKTLECLRQGSDLTIPEHCAAILIIEVDGDPEFLNKQMSQIAEIMEPLGVIEVRIAQTDGDSAAIWEFRKNVSPSLRQVNPDKFNEDIVVPRSKVPEMIHSLEMISEKYHIPIVNFGHAGDGNIHVNVMVDLAQSGMQEKVDEAIAEIFSATIALGGSISGEHGISNTKSAFIAMEIDEKTLSCMKVIKKGLDPNNIMNPGKIFSIP